MTGLVPLSAEDNPPGPQHIPYFCPTSGSTECCSEHSGWSVCCDRPDLHRPGLAQEAHEMGTRMDSLVAHQENR